LTKFHAKMTDYFIPIVSLRVRDKKFILLTKVLKFRRLEQTVGNERISNNDFASKSVFQNNHSHMSAKGRHKIENKDSNNFVRNVYNN